MNHINLAKSYAEELTTAPANESIQDIALMSIAHALISLVETINTNRPLDIAETRLDHLESFAGRIEDDIEMIANRNPQPCPTCSQPQRYSFTDGWNCLNMSCPDYVDDIPF